MKPMAKMALEVVQNDEVKIYPERWIKTYNHWLENIKDWCISRQLWWGHRIPVWYCNNTELQCKEPIVCIEKESLLSSHSLILGFNCDDTSNTNATEVQVSQTSLTRRN